MKTENRSQIYQFFANAFMLIFTGYVFSHLFYHDWVPVLLIAISLIFGWLNFRSSRTTVK